VKYARAAIWIFYSWLLRRLHMPKRWTREAEDQASMRMFDCSADFEPVGVTTAPIGWRCPHLSVTVGGAAILSQPTVSMCGCTIEPVMGGATR
jgi:hypothetical protein